MSKHRVVFDTSVVVSAALFAESVPRRALDLALETATILASDDCMLELSEVLLRRKFGRYLDEEDRQAFLALLLIRAEHVDITVGLRRCRDPKDDKFLELATCGDATHLVTGDDDLLSLHPFGKVSIVSPQAFLESLEHSQTQ